jgi:hypothetical protein
MSVYVPDPALNDWVPLWNLGNNVPAVQPAARVYHSAAQSIPTGVATTLNFDSERFDTDNIHDTVTNNDRLTCRTSGKYVVGAGVHFTGAGGNYRQLILLVNGTIYAIDRRPPLGGGVGLQSHLNTTVDLRAGDYVQVQYGHDIGSGSSVILGGNYSPEFWMALIGGMQGPAGVGVPTPVVNGQWIKGVGGAAVWSAIAASDIAGYPGGDQTKALSGDGSWQPFLRMFSSSPLKVQIGGPVTLSFPAGSGQLTINLAQAWPASHSVFVATAWPLAHWNFSYQGSLPQNAGAGYIAVNNTTAQQMSCSWVSFGY